MNLKDERIKRLRKKISILEKENTDLKNYITTNSGENY